LETAGDEIEQALAAQFSLEQIAVLIHRYDR
jgi:hypothetical protein